MSIKDRYINAVSARLIHELGFMLLEVAGQEGLVALIRKKDQELETIFFVRDETAMAFINIRQMAGIKAHMDYLKCERATIVSIFPDGLDKKPNRYAIPGIDDDILVCDVWVDISQGIIEGDEPPVPRLEPLLKYYADVPRLERYNPIDLRTIRKVDRDVKPIITRGIIAINVLMWVLMTLAGGSTNIRVLIKFGAMYGPLVLRGEYWRFITPMFLHVGFMHLAFNSYALYQLGGLAERIYGKYRFIIIYGIAGISGSFFSFVFTRAVSAGASGAIFGMLGALLYFGRKRPGVFRRGFTANLVTILLINLFIGFINPGIDNFAHLGGLTGGYMTAKVLLKKQE